MNLKTMLIASAAAAGLFASALAGATAISVRAFVGASLVGSSGSTTLGTVSFNYTGGNTTISATAIGEPTLPMPAFSGINSTVGSNVAQTVRIEFTQTDVTKASAGDVDLTTLLSTATANFLIGPAGIDSINVWHFGAATNAAWATDTLLASASFLPAGGVTQTFGPAVGILDLTSATLFSETIRMDVVFNGTTLSNALITSQIISGVPEPATLGLLGLALAGLGMARRRRAA